MESVRIDQLDPAVMSLLTRAAGQNGLVVQDEQGIARYGIVPFRHATADQHQKAENALARLQAQAADAMTREGITEDDLDRALVRTGSALRVHSVKPKADGRNRRRDWPKQ